MLPNVRRVSLTGTKMTALHRVAAREITATLDAFYNSAELTTTDQIKLLPLREKFEEIFDNLWFQVMYNVPKQYSASKQHVLPDNLGEVADRLESSKLYVQAAIQGIPELKDTIARTVDGKGQVVKMKNEHGALVDGQAMLMTYYGMFCNQVVNAIQTDINKRPKQV